MTGDEKKKLYQLLAAPFPESCIQRTEGRITGRGYDTTGIGYQHIVNRLNEVVGVGGWRAHRELTVKEITTVSGRKAYECVCDLILELGEWVDGEFQVVAEALADGGHTSLSEADARKGAYTNGLKKAAAMFGVGRQAYEGTLDDDNVPAEGNVHQAQSMFQKPAQAAPQASAQPVVAQPCNQLAPASQPSGQTRNRLTAKQLSAIWAISRKLGIDQHSLRASTKARYGLQPEFLGRAQASELIGELSKQAGNGHAQAMEALQAAEG
jgi:hypothetical protein